MDRLSAFLFTPILFRVFLRVLFLPAFMGFFCLSGNAGEHHIVKRVVYGEPAPDTHFPWMAGIDNARSQHPFDCGASLIGNRWLMTARHCVMYDFGALIPASRISFSLYALDGNRLPVRQIRNIYVNPGFNRHLNIDGHTDFALIETEDEFPDVPKLALSVDTLTDADITELYSESGVDNDSAYIAGWGATENGFLSQASLQWASPPLLTRQEFTDSFGSLASGFTGEDFHFHLLAGRFENTAADTCNGDSGSSLWLAPSPESEDAQAIGIVVSSADKRIPCGAPGQVGIYLRLSTVKDFILSTKGISDSNPFQWQSASSNQFPDGGWRTDGRFQSNQLLCRVGRRAGYYDSDNQRCTFLNDFNQAIESSSFDLLTGSPREHFSWQDNPEADNILEFSTCSDALETISTTRPATDCQTYCLISEGVGIVRDSQCVIPSLTGHRYFNHFKRLLDISNRSYRPGIPHETKAVEAIQSSSAPAVLPDAAFYLSALTVVAEMSR